MPDLVIHPASGPLLGSVPVVGDKSIAHRAILFAGLATGTSSIRTGTGALGEDNLATLAALRAMGASAIEEPGLLRIEGAGLEGLRPPIAPIDCGNSGTTMRLLCGVL